MYVRNKKSLGFICHRLKTYTKNDFLSLTDSSSKKKAHILVGFFIHYLISKFSFDLGFCHSAPDVDDARRKERPSFQICRESAPRPEPFFVRILTPLPLVPHS